MVPEAGLETNYLQDRHQVQPENSTSNKLHPKQGEKPRPDLKYSAWANGQRVRGWRSQMRLLKAIKAFWYHQDPGSWHNAAWVGRV